MFDISRRILVYVNLIWHSIMDRANWIHKPPASHQATDQAIKAIDRGLSSSGLPHITLEHRYSKFRERAQFITELASVLLEYFYCNGTAVLLIAAKELCQEHVKLATISNSLHKSMALARMGDVLFALYEQHWDPDDLERSIRFYQMAFSYSEAAFTSHCDIEVGLAWALWHRFQYYSTSDDCIKAVNILEAARDRIGVNSSGQTRILAAISRLRFQASTRSVIPPTSQSMAETLARLVALPKDTLSQSQYITSLIAEAYLNMQLSMSSLEPQYLHDGFRAAKRALYLCPEQAIATRYHCEHVLYVLHFYASMHVRNEETVWESHINAAIEIANHMVSEACAISQQNTNMRYVNSLYFWGTVLGDRSNQLRDLDGMERSVSSLKEALSLCPSAHASKPTMLNNLTVVLNNYHHLTGQASVLDEMISLYDLGPDYLVANSFLATSVARAIMKRARISDPTTSTLLLNQAIDLCQRRKSVPGFAVQRPMERIEVDMCMMHAVVAQSRMGITPSSIDLSTLIQVAREDLHLLEGIPAGRNHRTELVLALVEWLHMQAITEHDMCILQEAEVIVDAELSTSARSVGPPNQWLQHLLSTQAELLVTRSNLGGLDQKLLMSAWKTFESAVQIPYTHLHERFQTCLHWASLATEQENLDSASTAYANAIALLPSVIFIGEDVIGRIEALRQVSGLSASSVTVALSRGEIDVAVDFLEKTRGILWSQSLQTRAPQLQSLPVSIRERFASLMHKVEDADPLQWSIRRQRAEELQKAVSEIRAMPSFERFLLPPLLIDIDSVLQREGGYTIIIVLSTTACDVLALGTPEGHTHFRLGPDLNIDRLRELSLGFGTVRSAARTAQRDGAIPRKIFKAPIPHTSSLQDEGQSLLAELWVSLVHPIIKKLNISRTSDRERRKRVWWCPIGSLGSLPLHAAGIYDIPAQDSVDSYVISSYTPTLSALHRLLEEDTPIHKPVSSSISPTVLLVAQPDAVDLPLLPNARKEAELIRTLIPLKCFADQSDSHDMTTDAALRAASATHIVHFACHGHQDQENPLNSGFDLKDGRLTLGQLMRTKASHAQLAYLSACESAGIDHTRPDEGLNLVGAMIFAGFRSVIGTMWAMDDIDGPFMAKRIYSRIFRDGVLDMTAVPHAVDDAVRELRESGVPASRWATYVHFGV